MYKIQDINSFIKIPKITIANTANVDRKEAVKPVDKLPINIIDTVIKRGNLPLQGTKLLVKIAINFSLGESIILHPTTPHALQPKPHTSCKSMFSENYKPF